MMSASQARARTLTSGEVQALAIFEPGKSEPYNKPMPTAGSGIRSPAEPDRAEASRMEGIMHPSADVHFHLRDYAGRGPWLASVAQWMRKNNIRHALLSPIPTPPVSLTGDQAFETGEMEPGCCGESYYLGPEDMTADRLTSHQVHLRQQQIELNVDSAGDWHLIAEFKALPAEDQKMFDIAMTGLNLGDKRAYLHFLRNLEAMDVDIAAIGEVTLSKEMVMYLLPNRGQADLDDNIKPMCTLLQTAGIVGMPVIMHCDMGSSLEDSRPSHPRNLDGVVKLLEDPQTHDTTIIWAHCGGVSRFGPIAENHYEYIDQLLQRHPNLMIDVSWARVASKVDQKKLAELVNKHPTRFLMGSDALAPQEARVITQTSEIYNRPGGLIDQLSPEARDSLLLQNYKRIIQGGKENGKRFKEHVIPQIKHLLTDVHVNGLRPDVLRELTMRLFSELDPEHFETLITAAQERHALRDVGKKIAEDYGPLEPRPGSEESEAQKQSGSYLNVRDKLDREIQRLMAESSGATESKIADQPEPQPDDQQRRLHAALMRDFRTYGRMLRHETPALPVAPPIQVVDEEENQRCAISCLPS
jgi:hypothetical protein